MEADWDSGRTQTHARSLKWMDWVRVQPWRAPWVVPTLQSHRGVRSAGVLENTLEAFRLAARVGYSMVEMDIRLSKDGAPVVFHDESLWRLHGRRERVFDLSQKELGRLGIPSLREVLLAADVPAFLNIELKSDPFRLGRLERAVVEVVRESRSEERVLFSSFAPASLLFLQRLLPQVPRAYLVASRGDLIGRGLWWGAVLLDFHILHVEDGLATDEFMEKAAGLRIPAAVWTINDQARAGSLISKGAKSVITDSPTRWEKGF